MQLLPFIGLAGFTRKRRNPVAPTLLPAGEVEAELSQPHLPLLQPRPQVHPLLAPLLLLRQVSLTQPSSLAETCFPSCSRSEDALPLAPPLSPALTSSLGDLSHSLALALSWRLQIFSL